MKRREDIFTTDAMTQFAIGQALTGKRLVFGQGMLHNPTVDELLGDRCSAGVPHFKDRLPLPTNAYSDSPKSIGYFIAAI